MGEDRVGVFAREFDAGVRGARLEDHRLALRRTPDIERPRDLEETAPVVERVPLLAHEELAGLAIARNRVLVPAVPQPLRDFEILA